MVQVLEVEDWHWVETSIMDEQNSVHDRIVKEKRFYCTFINAAAEAALETPAPVDELHVGTHVGLASVAADWTRLAVVHHVQRRLRQHREIIVKLQQYNIYHAGPCVCMPLKQNTQRPSSQYLC